MERNTLNQFVLLFLSSAVLYFSGIHILKIHNITSLFDGFIVMIFFFAFFPFIFILGTLSFKLLKSLRKVIIP